MRDDGWEAHLPRRELIKDDDLPAGVDVRTGLERRDDEVARREPRVGVVVEAADELVADELGGFGELGLWSEYCSRSVLKGEMTRRTGEDARRLSVRPRIGSMRG